MKKVYKRLKVKQETIKQTENAFKFLVYLQGSCLTRGTENSQYSNFLLTIPLMHFNNIQTKNNAYGAVWLSPELSVLFS